MNGVIIVDKPKNCTSHDIVNIVKRIVNTKVGHTGTLDPNATGVLPILIGEGTKISKYLINHDKEYIATIKLGQKTDTLDSEGKVIEEKEVKEEWLNVEKINKILKTFEGKQEQVPPIYSAIKVNGKKLYEYARKGQNVDIKPRSIEIYSIILKSIKNNEIIIDVKCSKGTYIRSLCSDISEKIGKVRYMKELRRMQVSEIEIKNSIDGEKLLKKEIKLDDIQKDLITIEELFKDKSKIILNKKMLQLYLNGVQLSIKQKDGIYNIYDEQNEYIGIGIISNNKLKRDIVISK